MKQPKHSRRKSRKKVLYALGVICIISLFIIWLYQNSNAMRSLIGNFFSPKDSKQMEGILYDQQQDQSKLKEEKALLFDSTNKTEIKYEEVNLDADKIANSVIYNDEIYVYNDDILNYLFIGIDDNDGEVLIGGKQADTILIGSIDTNLKTIKMIRIPRDTLVEIIVLDVDYNYAATEIAPIALAHAYGDGQELSVELCIEAVEKLMYNVPIYRYFKLEQAAVPYLVDAIGGVELVIKEDFTHHDEKMIKGESVLLNGYQANLYISQRDIGVNKGILGGDIDSRMPRQLQLVEKYIDKAKQEFQQNNLLPINLIKEVKEYTSHNLSTSEILYLANYIFANDVSDNDVYVLEGEVTPEGYILDEDKLREIVINLFFNKYHESIPN